MSLRVEVMGARRQMMDRGWRPERFELHLRDDALKDLRVEMDRLGMVDLDAERPAFLGMPIKVSDAVNPDDVFRIDAPEGSLGGRELRQLLWGEGSCPSDVGLARLLPVREGK